MRSFKIFNLLSLLFLSANLSAQIDTGKKYKYEILKNQPEKVPVLSLGVSPVVADVSSINISAGMRGDLFLRFFNRVWIQGGFQHAYLHLYSEKSSEFSNFNSGVSVYELTKDNSGDILISIFPFVKVHKKAQTVKLKSTGRTDYVAMVDAERMVLFGPRVGFTKGVGFIHNSNVIFRGYDVSDPNRQVEAFIGERFNPMFTYTMLNFGLTFTIVEDLVTKWEDFGERSTHADFQYYADVLFATNVQIDNMLIPIEFNQSLNSYQDYREFHVDSHTKKSKVGFKTGVLSGSLSPFGFYLGAEGGMRPGVVNAFFINLKAGIRFSAL